MLNHLIEFFARTHLLVLHYPIALITTAAMIDTTRALWFKITPRSNENQHRPSNAAAVMIPIALASSIVAVTTGLVLGFDYSNAADLHRILGIVSAVLILATTIALVIARKRATTKASIVYLSTLGASTIAVAITGHLGGDLTHGSGFLTNPIKQIFNPTPDQQTAPRLEELNISPQAIETYNTLIQPIFDASCIECHGSKKSKADLRLDTLAYTLDPSTHIIERGSPDTSELVYLIELPSDDEEAMPPEESKADPLTKEQIQLIRNWIDSLAEPLPTDN